MFGSSKSAQPQQTEEKKNAPGTVGVRIKIARKIHQRGLWFTSYMQQQLPVLKNLKIDVISSCC